MPHAPVDTYIKYKINVNLESKRTYMPPVMLGPMMLHWDGNMDGCAWIKLKVLKKTTVFS